MGFENRPIVLAVLAAFLYFRVLQKRLFFFFLFFFFFIPCLRGKKPPSFFSKASDTPTISPVGGSTPVVSVSTATRPALAAAANAFSISSSVKRLRYLS